MNHDYYYYYNLLNKFGKVACFVYKLLYNFFAVRSRNLGYARKKTLVFIFPHFLKFKMGAH